MTKVAKYEKLLEDLTKAKRTIKAQPNIDQKMRDLVCGFLSTNIVIVKKTLKDIDGANSNMPIPQMVFEYKAVFLDVLV